MLQINEAGFITRKGQVVYASFVTVPRQRNWNEMSNLRELNKILP